MTSPVRFWVRPVYHGSELLVEVLGDHRADGFPDVAAILQGALHSTREPHPENLDDTSIAMFQDRYFSYWKYAGGFYEIDDDIWSLFVTAKVDNTSIIADIERALLASGDFVKETVDFGRFK